MVNIFIIFFKRTGEVTNASYHKVRYESEVCVTYNSHLILYTIYAQTDASFE